MEVHGLWVAKLARNGMDVSSLESLRHDHFILEPHALETATRTLIATPNKFTLDLCRLWLSAEALWETYRKSWGPDDPVPYHFVPLLSDAGQTIITAMRETSQSLRCGIQETVSPEMSDVEAKKQQLHDIKADAEAVLAVFPESERERLRIGERLALSTDIVAIIDDLQLLVDASALHLATPCDA